MKPIIIYGNGEYEVIQPEELICVKADKRYTEVFVKNDSDKKKPYIKHCVCKNLGQFEKHLPASLFSRVSRQIIINLHYLKGICEGCLELKIDIEETIAIGKAYRPKLMRKFTHIK